jgi:hypothetical protein
MGIILHAEYWGERQKEESLGRPISRLVHVTGTDLIEIKWCDMNWLDLAQGT